MLSWYGSLLNIMIAQYTEFVITLTLHVVLIAFRLLRMCVLRKVDGICGI